MKNKIISIPLKNVQFEADEQFDLKKVSLNLFSEGVVPSHGLYIEKETLESLKDTINLKPILCAYEVDEEGNKTDFMGHEIEYELIQEGNKITIKQVYIEQPVGVLEDSNCQITEVDGVSWLTCDGYLYNEYCEDAVRILDEGNGEKSVSIELKILDGFDGEDNLYHIKKAHFLGVTLLGDMYNPAIQNANITKFTQYQNEAFIKQFEKIVNNVNRLKNSKGGTVNLKREELIAKFESLKGNEEYEKLIANTDLSDEDLENQLFSLSNKQVERAIREALSEIKVTKTNSWGESWESQKYWLEDVLTSENIAICENNENWYAYYGIPYEMQGDKAILKVDEAKRYIKGDWRLYEGDESEIQVNPALFEELQKINEKVTCEIQEKEKIQNDLDTVKADFTDLNSKFEEAKDELDRLQKFEAETKEKEHQEAINEVVSKFAELKDIQGFDELVQEKSKESIEELEKSLKVFAFDNGITLKKNKKNFSAKEPQLIKTNSTVSGDDLTEAEKRYGISIKKYMTNY